jgi:transposase
LTAGKSVLPHLATVVIEAVTDRGAGVILDVRLRGEEATCPHCGQPSSRVHSRYHRRLEDAPIAGRAMSLRLRVRRFFCDNPGCGSRTFAEQADELTTPRARRTLLLRSMLMSIAVALAGRAGARLAGRLGMSTSRDSLLRLLRTLPDPQPDPLPGSRQERPRLLGIDDFALRRGHVYGTVVVDMISGRPVDLLPDRQSSTVAAWLEGRPEIEVICRDRAGAYAEAAARAAPQAVQVADRWHLWHNLAGHLERVVLAHRRCLRELPTSEPASPVLDMAAAGADATTDVDTSGPELWIVTRTRERYQTITALRAAGESIAQIARELGLDRRTVRRFARATGEEELQAKNRQRATLLDDYADYLHRRWSEGCTDAAALAREITAMGYRGSVRTVRTYLHPLHSGQPIPPPRAATPPTVREVTSWILRRPDTLSPDEQARLQQVLAHCPQLDSAATHVATFAEMMCGRHGDRLDAWLAAVEADTLIPLHRFTTGLRRDYDAVRAGLTLEHNSRRVEGTVNKIKMIKRQMFGRANFDLLRTRVLHAR